MKVKINKIGGKQRVRFLKSKTHYINHKTQEVVSEIIIEKHYSSKTQNKLFITPKQFNKLNSRERWKIVERLGDDVLWCCNNCGIVVDDGVKPTTMFMGERCCSECDNTLTYRTNGGQSDPCNYTFKLR